jgi:outer membrane protein insertion porin family
MKYYLLYLSIFSFLCVGCKSTKFVPEGDSLYTGSNFTFQTNESKKIIKKIKSDLDNQLKPKPNFALLGIPIKLNIYTFLGNPKNKKGLRYNLRTKFGQAPVLFSTINTSFSEKALTAALFNDGLFDAEVTYDIITSKNKKKTQVNYLIKTGPLYRIDNYVIQIKDTAIVHLLKNDKPNSKIEVNKGYNLEQIKTERVIIDDLLKNNGYYYFNPDFLVFEADTSGKKDSVQLRLKLKPQTTEKSLRRYTLSNVYVLLDSSYTDKHIINTSDTVMIEKVIFNLNDDFKAGALSEYVYLKGDTYYSRENQKLTISRLMGMNLFKYVDVTIEEKDSTALNVYIHLAPLPKRSVSIETELVSKSTNFVGPGMNLNYTDRNAFKGGEKLSLGFHGSIETQLNGQFKGLYTYEFGPQLNLTIPRFILPFNVKASSYFTPSTIFTSSYTNLNRVNYFQMRSLQLSYGYKWKEDLATEHYLRPININYFSISNISTDFQQILNITPGLNRRYENQFIAGIMYSYTYNQQVYQKRKDQIYFKGNIDISGNSLNLLNTLTGSPENSDGVKTIMGTAYAQYAKFDIDLRNYLKVTKNTVFASRMIIGYAIPYGNSSALPFVRGFFSGGANSLRAFPVNSVGPGTYHVPDSLQSDYFLQQGGDIKLEFNTEYRFPIVSIIKGALFVDAGNVWLKNENALIPGGQFKLNTAFTELAVGGGFGLRVDLDFFIIRLDLATPMRKPWYPEGNRWVLDEVKLGSRDWRRQNLILNIAIGYPF